MKTVAGLRPGLTLSKVCDTLAHAFRAAGIESPQLDSRLLICHALGIDRARLAVETDRVLDAGDIGAISAPAARRLAHEPVARILGSKEFWSLPLQIGPAVLVPRPDTETVVETALDVVTAAGGAAGGLRVLDIGTGSGALLLALLSEWPDATGVGTDISVGALAVARANAVKLGLDRRCHLIACDIASALEGPFDVIVSNPPYVASADIAGLAPEVRDYDPATALDGGADGLAVYRAIAADAKRLLRPHRALIVELGAGQEAAVTQLLTTAGLSVPGPARRDLGGVGRALPAFAP